MSEILTMQVVAVRAELGQLRERVALLEGRCVGQAAELQRLTAELAAIRRQVGLAES